ncbi:acyltransferase [Entomomonas sp. E2T0]|uniref:acyltransferase family protein n=1 Tax=Entomomonas sp. E2T0 TaxID=2930213 RepID=UPI00222847FD|nr:acyltransferase family protein [Entomomonas sp. E2T0]UYZ82833.1 acyltransferase [Entomomonas sp. E2T0]
MTFRKDINGLRAIAVLAVILFHFKIPYFNGGFAGVDIFFVISGYLMTGIIFTRVNNNNFSIIDFYLHRAKRILPALAALCITLAFFGFFFLLTNDLREITQHIRKVILFISNYTFYESSGYFDTPSQENWLLHTWSLSVEWQFYLIYPLIILGLSWLFTPKKTSLIIIIMAVASLIFSIIYTPINPSFAFYSLPTRSWEMLAGGIVFLFPLSFPTIIKKLTLWIGLVLILLGLMTLNDSLLWPSYLALIPVIGTMLIIWSNQNSAITSNLLFQWLGKISYSIYLWHWPIAVLLLISGLLTNPFYKIAGIVVSLIAGYLSYFFIEKRFKLVHSQIIEIIKYIGIILITIVIAASLGSLAKHYPQLRNQSLQDLNNIVENKFKTLSKRCLLSKFDNSSDPNCIIGEGNINIIVLGDSHAATLFPAITKLNTDKASLFWTLSSCPSIEGVKQKTQVGCTEFVSTRLELLKSSYSGIPILISNRLTYYFYNKDKNIYFTDNSNDFHNDFRNAYINTMCQIATNHPVYALKPIPAYPYDIPKKMVTDRLFHFNKTPMTISMPEYYADNKIILDIMEETSKKCGIHLLDPTDYLCENGICHAQKGNTPLYVDDNHLSDQGAMELAPLFQKILN